MYLVKQLVEEVDDDLAHRHGHQQGEDDGEGDALAEAIGETGESEGEGEGEDADDGDVPMGTRLPVLRREELPSHMFALGIGLGHELFHQLIFRLPFSVLRFPFGQSDDLGPVVVLGAVVHLVVHASLLSLEGLLGIAHAVDEFRHGHARHLLQRVEEVHHHQVVLGGLVEFLHVGHRSVGGGVVVGVGGLKVGTETGQLLQQDVLHQWNQSAYLGVGEIVLAVFLGLLQIVEKHLFVDLIVVVRQEAAQHLLETLHGLAFETTEVLALQIHFQHFFLLANHVVVVENPLIGAAYQAL